MRTPGGEGLTFGSNTPENQKRLRELILYVAEKCGSDSKFGATKLNKILFWADFYSFARTGKPLTGVQYMRQQHGPVPKHFLPVRDEMIEEGELDVSERELFNGQRQIRFFAKRKPDVSVFTTEQIELVNEIIKYLRDQTAEEVSVQTHGRVWKSIPNGTLIPYEAIFVSDRGLLQSDIDAIREMGERLNWRDRIKARRGSLKEPVEELG